MMYVVGWKMMEAAILMSPPVCDNRLSFSEEKSTPVPDNNLLMVKIVANKILYYIKQYPGLSFKNRLL